MNNEEQKATEELNYRSALYSYWDKKNTAVTDLYSLSGRPWVACLSIYGPRGNCISNFHKTFQNAPEARQYANRWINARHYYHRDTK